MEQEELRTWLNYIDAKLAKMQIRNNDHYFFMIDGLSEIREDVNKLRDSVYTICEEQEEDGLTASQ